MTGQARFGKRLLSDRGIRGAALIASAALFTFSVTRNTAFARLVAGIALLFAGGELFASTRMRTRMAAALPGATLVASGVGVTLTQRWAAPLVVVVVVVGAGTATHLARRITVGTVWLVMLMTIGGIYACVPETGHIRPLAIAAGLLALVELVTAASLGAGATTAAVGALAWSVAYGGTYRDSALVGGFASFGVLLLEPVAQLLAQRLPRQWISGRRSMPLPMASAAIVAIQAAGALLVSRTAGLARTLAGSIALTAPTLLAMVVLIAVFAGTPAPGRPVLVASAPTQPERNGAEPDG